MQNEELKKLWKDVLAEIELNISRANFVTWFKNSAIVEKTDDTVTVATNSNFAKEWLENRYNKYIKKALDKFSPGIKNIIYKTETIDKIEKFQAVSEKEIKKPETGKVKKGGTLTESLSKSSQDPDTNLNSKYTFDSLVVGSHNELAHAAALAIIDNLGAKYNPLFIYGGVGLGKTHLMQALGNAVRQKSKKINIWYINTERLVNDIIGSIREQTIDEVKKQYKKIDLLLIDDIQFIANKEKTQEEVFHIFNVLYEANKQIVFTSDRPPKAIPGLEERLRSRFEGGMVADISLPNYETRVAILKNKLKDKKTVLPEEIVDYIAQNITNNVRELEGALNTLLINFEVKKINPSIELSKKLLEDFIKKPKKMVTPQDVLKVVSVFYDISTDKIKVESRRKDLVKARQITMYILRDLVKLSYPAIGEVFNNKDHTTVMHSCKKIEEEKIKDSVLNNEIESLIEKLSYDVFN